MLRNILRRCENAASTISAKRASSSACGDGVPSPGHFRPCGLPVLPAPTDELSIDPMARAEDIGVADYVRLSNYLDVRHTAESARKK